MNDMELGLDNDESLKIYAYEGAESICVFVWKKEEHSLHIAVEIGQEEKFCVEINHAGQEIKVTKNLG